MNKKTLHHVAYASALGLSVLINAQTYADTPLPPYGGGAEPYAQAFADKLGSGSTGQDCQGIKCLRPITDYLRIFGAGFGINLAENLNNINASLIERTPDSLGTIAALSVYSLLGATPLPVYSSAEGIKKVFLDGVADETAFLNQQSGTTFYQFRGGSNKVKVAIVANEKANQTPIQPDPLNQSLLNLISTQPQCALDDDKKKMNDACVDKLDVINQIFLPDSMSEYYLNDKNKNPALITKLLNSNSLVTPMLLSSEAKSASQNPEQSKPSFDMASPVENANQFIQYVGGTTIPLDMPSAQLLTEKGADHLPAIKAYTAIIRTYAARMSVGLGNLYYLLSKRVPQELSTPKTAPSGGGTKVTSQALMEYKMATWRLFNTDDAADKQQWVDKINTATPATVQKEMAMLLAEINYQLYLNRQQQERLLMTNSVLLLISANTVPPSVRDLERELAK